MVLDHHHHHHQTKIMKRLNQPWYYSWEDQEEAGGALRGGGGGGGEGYAWPPRSYTCSFCKRDFRSAQALGGHMNVHRRDRALLKQVNLSDHTLHYPPFDHHHHLLIRDHHHDDHHKSLPKSMAPTNPSQLSPHRTSASHDLSPCTNSVISGVKKVISTNDVAQVKLCMAGRYPKEEMPGGGGGGGGGRGRSGGGGGGGGGGGEKEENLSSKRCKSDNQVALLPLFLDEIKCSNFNGSHDPIASNLVKDLDLELRLSTSN